MTYRCQQILNTVWLSCYPRPKEIGNNNGSKFKEIFEELYKNMGLTPARGYLWNPQPNSILERIYQVLTDSLLVFNLENADIDPEDNDPFDKYISSVCYNICSSYEQTHGYSPAQLVFGCNMMGDTATLVDWDKIKRRKQEKICKINQQVNASRIEHTYQPGNEILINQPGIVQKLAIHFEGPKKVVSHSVSRGSITYKKSLTENHKRSNKILSNRGRHFSVVQFCVRDMIGGDCSVHGTQYQLSLSGTQRS